MNDQRISNVFKHLNTALLEQKEVDALNHLLVLVEIVVRDIHRAADALEALGKVHGDYATMEKYRKDRT